jgi:hypothetical protein
MEYVQEKKSTSNRAMIGAKKVAKNFFIGN